MKRILKLLALVMIVDASKFSCKSHESRKIGWISCEYIFASKVSLQLRNTTGLSIRYSNFSTINANTFGGFKHKLEELNMTESKIKTIHPDTFKNFDRLRVLNLEGNSIQNLDVSWIQHLTNLKALFLGKNAISTIEPQIYNLLSQLETLDISANYIKTCPRHNLKKLVYLRRLYIDKNPLQMNCRRRMLNYCTRKHIYTDIYFESKHHHQLTFS